MKKKKTLVKYEATSRGYDELYGEEQRKKYFKALSKINCKFEDALVFFLRKTK